MDDHNGRGASQAPSSHSDFYSSDSPAVQNNMPAQPGAPHAGPTKDNGPDDDSSSEMDTSGSSRAASPEPEPCGEPPPSPLPMPDVALAADEATLKRQRISLQVYQGGESIPFAAHPELWQRIFLHLPPAVLARCLGVCRTFNTCLTSTKGEPTVVKARSKGPPIVRAIDSQSLWTSARKTFLTSLPRPLARCENELQMLQLIGGKTCQNCGRIPTPSPSTTPFNRGPGRHGVRIFWPFGIRACGDCIEQVVFNDLQLLTSPGFARLRSGLPYVFLTPELHFIPDTQRHSQEGIPSHLRANKVYYNKDIDTIRQECEVAEYLGATEEWYKGLANKGKDAMSDAARWEKWEGQLRPGTDLSHVLREYDLSSYPNHLADAQGRLTAVPNGPQPDMVVNIAHSLPPPPIFHNGFGTQYQAFQPPYQQPHRTSRNQQEAEANRILRKADIERRCMELEPPLEPHFLQHMPAYNAAVIISQPLTDAAWEMLRPKILKERKHAEAEANRVLRKADIERRCMELEPPLEPRFLPHMLAYNAAVIISQPLTDAAWEMLRPKILNERKHAEDLEHHKQEQLAALQAAVPAPEELCNRPAREVYTKDYQDTQEPLRKRLGEYADEFITRQWNGGQALDKMSVPVFSVQTILYVYERYSKDKAAGLLPSSDPPIKEESSSARTRSRTLLPDPFLSLDNMKWVYDNVIRPLTDSDRGEIFLCAGCINKDQNSKWFAFESLIQHYGAIHATGKFSQGNITVHWQTAEWPETPPFHPDPSPWIVQDRRTSNYKGHPRARNTPQASRDGQYFAPGRGQVLTETPFSSSQVYWPPSTSNGYPKASSTYPTHQHGHSSAQAVSYGYDMSHQGQLVKLSNDASKIWDSLDGVEQLPDCVRVQTTIYHMVKLFTDHFGRTPDLDLVTDALANQSSMKQMKNAQDLACKICVARQTNGCANSQYDYVRITKVDRLYNVSSLMAHFKWDHPQSNHPGQLDWTKDMIELPETHLIGDLIRAPGMDDDKLFVIAAAFPDAFPTPLPKIGVVQEALPDPRPLQDPPPDSALMKRLMDRLDGKQKQPRKKRKTQHAGNGTSSREDSVSLPEPKEDEYDPRRPMYIKTEENASDPARFDTDVARRPSVGPSPFSAGGLNLAPETLAALNNFTAPTVYEQEPRMDDRAYRSPSVGCAEPDISAILASLTGQAQSTQTALPPTTSGRSGSVLKHSNPDQYSVPHRVSPRNNREGRPSPIPQPRYRTPEPQLSYNHRELEAALSRNSRHHEHNRAPTHVAPLFGSQHHSQPAYQVVYDEGQQYRQHPQHSPVYHQESRVQFVQVATGQEYQRQAAPYAYEQPVQQHIYVDNHGRRLIPIDSAPAPVQYASHPYEQHQQQQHYARAAPGTTLAYGAAPPPPLPAAQQHFQQPTYEDRGTFYYGSAGPATSPPRGYGQ